MQNQIREWFIECRDATGKFPDYPDDEEGGSAAIFKEKDPIELEKELSEKGDTKGKKGKKKDKKDKKDKKKDKKGKKGKKGKDDDVRLLVLFRSFYANQACLYRMRKKAGKWRHQTLFLPSMRPQKHIKVTYCKISLFEFISHLIRYISV